MLCVSSAVQQLWVVCSGPGEWVATLNMCNPHKESVSGRSGPGNSYLSRQPRFYTPPPNGEPHPSTYILCMSVNTCWHPHKPFFFIFFFCRMLLFMLIRTNISALLLRLPNGWCGTECWQPGWHEYLPWNTTASQMPRSRLQNYLSLNKLHYGFYYPDTHSQKKTKTQKNSSTLQACCLPRTLVPSLPCRLHTARKSWTTEGDVARQEGKDLS